MTSTATKINLNQLAPHERDRLARETYAGESYFQHAFGYDEMTFHCTETANRLRHDIERMLVEKGIAKQPFQLENLHEHLSDEMRAYNFDDGVNKLTTFFYETDPLFAKSYQQLIAHIRQHIIKEPFYFQSTPTIRLHCPNAKNSDHYPRYHTDVGYGHPPEEINFWMPLTKPVLPQYHGFRLIDFATSIQLLEEFDYNFSNFIDAAINNKTFSDKCENLAKPVTTNFGDILAFDSRCIHSGEPLQQHTRVSIDIRVLPISLYETMPIEYQGSGRRKILFKPGHCYHELDSDTFFTNKGIAI